MTSHIPVYSFVAFSGTGKTTLLEKLIPEFKKRGFRIAAVKHDAHEFEIDYPGKDSWRMTQAGADVTVIASLTHAAIMENRPADTETLLSRIADVDIILTEGYKYGKWPKIGIYRGASGKPLPDVEEGFLAIMSDVPIETKSTCFELNDADSLVDIIVRDMQQNKMKLN